MFNGFQVRFLYLVTEGDSPLYQAARTSGQIILMPEKCEIRSALGEIFYFENKQLVKVEEYDARSDPR